MQNFSGRKIKDGLIGVFSSLFLRKKDEKSEKDYGVEHDEDPMNDDKGDKPEHGGDEKGGGGYGDGVEKEKFDDVPNIGQPYSSSMSNSYDNQFSNQTYGYSSAALNEGVMESKKVTKKLQWFSEGKGGDKEDEDVTMNESKKKGKMKSEIDVVSSIVPDVIDDSEEKKGRKRRKMEEGEESIQGGLVKPFG